APPPPPPPPPPRAGARPARRARPPPWPAFQVLCTVQLARRILARDEAPTVRLSALAQLLGASTRPTHRALDDARATVDVLHALIERVGNLGVHSLTELIDYLPEVSRRQRSKRFLAADLPAVPGVYLFRGPSDEVLYIGTAVNLRRRVRSYFTGSETRTRMREMVALATRVDHVPCAHGLEAGVRELRLLVAHTPPYNRRSKFPKRAWWLTLTAEPFPRFAITRTPTWDALGPFHSRADAAEVAALVSEYCGLRTCTARLPRHARHGGDCPPAVVGGCPASADGRLRDADEYAAAPRAVRDLFTGRSDAPLRLIRDRIENYATAEHFEGAARLRDHLAALVRALRRTQRLAALARIAELIAARPDGSGGWEFAVVRYGRLAAAGTAARGTAPMPIVESLVASAETVLPTRSDAAPADSARPRHTPDDGPASPPVPQAENPSLELDLTPHPDPLSDPRYPPLRGAPPEETALITRWLDQPGTRIVRTTDGYHEPRLGAGTWLSWLGRAESATRTEALGQDYISHT
ncbi:DEDD exonuclease domain-containing protein, partial [Nocardia wallacei]|uniref:DEDD exonuclease domain-containing protein n=1 Tax=Nocardia wallacei TaxID=480035 RepID=UPI002455860C